MNNFNGIVTSSIDSVISTQFFEVLNASSHIYRDQITCAIGTSNLHASKPHATLAEDDNGISHLNFRSIGDSKTIAQ